MGVEDELGNSLCHPVRERKNEDGLMAYDPRGVCECDEEEIVEEIVEEIEEEIVEDIIDIIEDNGDKMYMYVTRMIDLNTHEVSNPNMLLEIGGFLNATDFAEHEHADDCNHSCFGERCMLAYEYD